MSLSDVPDRVGGYGPQVKPAGIIGVSYDSVVGGDIIVPALGVFSLLPRNLGGDPIECTFLSWNDGDVLEVDLDITPTGVNNGEQGPASTVNVVALVSVDGGLTFQVLLPSQTNAQATLAIAPPLLKPSAGRSVTSLLVPGTTPPIIQIAYFADGSFALGGTAVFTQVGSAHLKCSRITPDTLEAPPTGVLVPFVP